ncbi:dTDP-4-dehydrorhamnose 3,5-epimerase [Croceivirga thetidis]|uniref:dTDP-4-dehydrorhamnose 3,5-epimerase n=1 Tax=Croceivirga thetidis TaxID=2721623 RepID=A0ABX1GQ93_9FLAO|nr:dTDP-4-dehydrorhamnose 3,5-epimerase [Croceivirga thetidis]NKI31206.1 dTDP-4-dehydrorhamnose 3,5-epimerase [Croceivirga thetidis]
MNVVTTPLEDCFVLKPEVFEDERGWFTESFNQKVFEECLGRKIKFVQDNRSFSKNGVLRGLHFQYGEYQQAKLISVEKGAIQDVCVDLRKDSSTYGLYFSIELSDSNKKQLFVPRGFAHGFLVLSNEAIVSYKCDNYYNRSAESGIIYNDLELDIPWNLKGRIPVVSEKDALWPTFQQQPFL